MIGLYFIGGTRKTILPPMTHMKMPMFSNNASVYYKPGSLSVGAGSVANLNIKRRRT